MSKSDELTALRELRIEIDQLKITLHELLKDKARLDWLADVDNRLGGVTLPSYIVERNMHSMRAAIDVAMSIESTRG